MPARFTLIRHGQTVWNVDGRWQGQANVPLNEHGHAQAAHLAAHLAKVDADAGVIYSSDLLRARQTADAIAARLNLPVILDARLREIDMGEWQGMTSEEAEAWDGERLAEVRKGSFTIRRPSGESQQDVADRVLALLGEINQSRAEEHVILVAHGGTIRILLIALNLWQPTHKFIENTSRSVLLYHAPEARWHLDSFNMLDHLPPLPHVIELPHDGQRT